MILTHITLFNFIPGATLSGTPPIVVTEDTHDLPRRNYEEERRQQVREDRERLTADLRAAVARVTGKPPSLDASPKELAAIARKSESFDYRAVFAEIERIQQEEVAIAMSAAAMAEAKAILEKERRVRRQEEEALLLLLLH